MSELKTVFDFITDPTRMKRSADPGERAAVEAWAAKWRSPCGPEWFLTVLRQLAGTTVRATTDEDDPPMELRVPPKNPDTPELREGIRLAVLVMRSASAPMMQPDEQVAFTRERRSIFATV